MAIFIASTLFLLWYYGIERTIQRKTSILWLKQNENLLTQYEDLEKLLDAFGARITCCKSCNSDKMQIWDYRYPELLVVRCTSCKLNYT